jgi:hypothetical protein
MEKRKRHCIPIAVQTDVCQKAREKELVWRTLGVQYDILNVFLLAHSSIRFFFRVHSPTTHNAAAVALCHGPTIRERAALLCRAVQYSSPLRYLDLNPFDRRPMNPLVLQ